MSDPALKTFERPDEAREFPFGRFEIVHVAGVTLGRATYQPGWKWSESIKPIAGTDSCQVHHLGVITAGRMHIVHEDGSEADINAGALSMYEVDGKNYGIPFDLGLVASSQPAEGKRGGRTALRTGQRAGRVRGGRRHPRADLPDAAGAARGARNTLFHRLRGRGGPVAHPHRGPPT